VTPPVEWKGILSPRLPALHGQEVGVGSSVEDYGLWPTGGVY